MTITIYRSSHDVESLNSAFMELFKSTDIFFQENCIKETGKGLKKHYNQLSFEGDSETVFSHDMFMDYLKALEGIITNSRKLIEIEDSPVTQAEDDRERALMRESNEAFGNGDLKNACEKKIEEATYGSKLIKRRDESLIGQLEDLQLEEPSKDIMVNFGAGHFIYPGLRKTGLDVKQRMYRRNYVFPLGAELQRRIAFGKNYTREMVARVMADNVIYSFLKRTGLPNHDAAVRSRKVSEKLSYGDVEKLSKYLSEKSYRKEMPGEATVMWLRNKGIEIDVT